MSQISGLATAGVVGAVLVFNIVTGNQAVAQAPAPKVAAPEDMALIFRGHDYVCDQADTTALQVHVNFSVSMTDTRAQGISPADAARKINPFIRDLRATWLQAWKQAAKDHAFDVSHENDKGTAAVKQAQAIIDAATKDVEAKTGITVKIETFLDGHSQSIPQGCSNVRLPGFQNQPIPRRN